MVRTGEFNFGDFNSSYASPTITSFPDGGMPGLQPIQPNPQTAYPPVPQHGHQHAAYPHHALAQPKAGEKRRPTEPSIPPSRAMSIEEASRVAAEEDKRRRNTAASARFRVKKKQREQALEKSAKEMSDKVSQLEAKISQLETENSWLKKLVLEKNDSGLKKDASDAANSTKDEIKVETKKAAESKKSKAESS